MRRPAALLLVLAVLPLGSCDGALPVARFAARETHPSPAMAVAPAPARAHDSASAAPGPTPSLEAMVAEDKLIRTAELRIQVQRVRGAIERMDSLTRSMGAFIADTRVTQDDKGRSDAELTLRVPVGQFTRVLDALRTLGRVENESVGTEDVTKD